MDDKQAHAVAHALGGLAWESGDNMWLALFERVDGKLVVISDEVICEYADQEAFENSQPEISILIH